MPVLLCHWLSHYTAVNVPKESPVGWGLPGCLCELLAALLCLPIKKCCPLNCMEEMLCVWPWQSEEHALQINLAPGSTSSCSQGFRWRAWASWGSAHGQWAGAGAGEMLLWSPLPPSKCSFSNPPSSLSLQEFKSGLCALYLGCCSGLLS